jgi:hypothetical protein
VRSNEPTSACSVARCTCTGTVHSITSPSSLLVLSEPTA